MNQSSKLKFYLINLFSLITITCPLLPWMSYGVGSKTGMDIGGKPANFIFLFSFLLIVISYILFKTNKIQKFFLYTMFFLSLSVCAIYFYELTKIGYQTMIAKNLPVEMFGVVSLATNQIRIGYGLWLGSAASLLSLIINYISIRIKS